MNENLASYDEHGTTTKYRQGCRCLPCKEATASYNKDLSSRKNAAQHGTRSMYSYRKCRCGPCVLANNAYELDRYHKNKANKRNKLYLTRYGISLEQYNELLEKQDNKCAICLVSQSDLSRRLDVDHNHITGEIRGLLCSSCNVAIGKLNVDSGNELLYAAIKYLVK